MNEIEEIRDRIGKEIRSGDYSVNLELAITHSIAALSEEDSTRSQYQLTQAMVQAQIATVLLLEELTGFTVSPQGEQQ